MIVNLHCCFFATGIALCTRGRIGHHSTRCDGLGTNRSWEYNPVIAPEINLDAEEFKNSKDEEEDGHLKQREDDYEEEGSDGSEDSDTTENVVAKLRYVLEAQDLGSGPWAYQQETYQQKRRHQSG